MQIQFQDAPMFLSSLTPRWLPGSLDQASGGFVVTIPATPGITRDDGTPSQAGDVLSVQPNGRLQSRPADKAAAWELCQPDATINVLRFNPSVPYAVVYRAA